MAHDRHRPFRALAALALLVALAPLALAAALPEPTQLAAALFGWTLAAYLWAAGGPLLAATTFAPGEAMRPAWLLLSASYALLLPARLLAGPGWDGLADGALRHQAPALGLSVLSAVVGVAAFLRLTRAWNAAGLDLTSRRARALMRLAALAIAAALAGPDVAERLPAAAAGEWAAAADVVTDLLDGALLVVAAPVLRAALALGGGLVAWPWGLLTLSLLAWLGYDASVIWGDALGLAPRAGRVLEEVMRTLGTTAVFAAGVAQRWVMAPPPDDRPPAA